MIIINSDQQGNCRHQTLTPALPPSDESLTIHPTGIAFASVAWPLTGKYDIHKTGSTQCTALLSEYDQATATLNMYRKFVKLGRVVFEICK